MGAQGKLNVPEAASAGNLGPHHREEMVPAGEVSHVSVPIVSFDKVIEILPVQVLAKLIENIRIFGHQVAK